ncbi:antitoxin [Salinifilum ghardaiensis]
MTRAMTVRLDDEADRQLAELAEDYPTRSAAVLDAIHEAWRRHREDRLDAAYAAAVVDNPAYPYEDAAEREAIRARRDRRQAEA